MNSRQIVDYYSQDFVVSSILEASKNREVGGALASGTYEKRPNILQYSSDIIQMAKKGVSSFHLSVERWQYPMQVSRKGNEDNRIGWDMIIDIDSKLDMEGAKIAVKLVCELLEKNGIKNYGIKFSGSRGFHVCIPWEMFPKEINYKSLALQYPDVPRIISSFIRKKIEKNLMKELIKLKGMKNLLGLLDEPPEKLDPYYFVDIEKNWGSRHLFRAPFSLNEKKWLVSLPLELKDVDGFSFEMASPAKVKSSKIKFFRGQENEALDLLTSALDWHSIVAEKPAEKKSERKVAITDKISEEFFPPCIKIILAGMKDGRKRSLFTLVHFLRLMNWGSKEIEDKILEWNNRNQPPLPQQIISGQLRYSQQNRLNPANCDNDAFYKGIMICQPDKICTAGTDTIKIKNPISYPLKRMGKKTKEDIQKPYKCGFCEKGFKKMSSLQIHKSRSHGVYE